MACLSFLKPPLPQEIFLKRIKEIPDFVIGQQFWSYDDKPFNGVLVDDKNRKIALLTQRENLPFGRNTLLFAETDKRLKQEQPNLGDNERLKLARKLSDKQENERKYFIQMCKYNDILRSEVVEDGNSVTNTKRMNQVASTAVGYDLMGGAGASSKKKNVNTATNVSVYIFVKDAQNPLFKIAFLNKEKEKDSKEYKDALDSANRLHSLISVLIRQADEEAVQDQVL